MCGEVRKNVSKIKRMERKSTGRHDIDTPELSQLEEQIKVIIGDLSIYGIEGGIDINFTDSSHSTDHENHTTESSPVGKVPHDAGSKADYVPQISKPVATVTRATDLDTYKSIDDSEAGDISDTEDSVTAQPKLSDEAATTSSSCNYSTKDTNRRKLALPIAGGV
jgi:hypothetical protein